MDFKTLTILIPMIIGFLGLIFSMHSMIKTSSEGMNRRIDDFRIDVDRRFDFVDRRFEVMDRRFDVVDQRFDAVDQKFDAVNQRFEIIDKKFFEVEKEIQEVKVDVREIKLDLREVRSRLDTFIDNFAIRIIKSSGKLKRNKV